MGNNGLIGFLDTFEIAAMMIDFVCQ